ncbi:hypothetical protein [Kibdelosporangium aridum]|uniref:hypothetical protein n=1 Tax=Kibdelosporangium aridum TaxID=2030 RepID=UPI000A985F45|nr:hypothetical protein [Kibdelosporangium aridum]
MDRFEDHSTIVYTREDAILSALNTRCSSTWKTSFPRTDFAFLYEALLASWTISRW